MLVGDQLVTSAAATTVVAAPTNFTDPEAPKLDPVMVRPPAAVAAATVLAESFVMHGAVPAGQLTVKLAGGLAVPPAVTTTLTGPAAMLGTFTVIVVGAQAAAGGVIGGMPPNVTVPGVLPRFIPVMVTGVPGAPKGGDRFVMHGPAAGQLTVKFNAGLSLPPAETTTGSEPTGTDGTVTTIDEGDQLLTTACTPVEPNFTTPDPCDAPKFVPLIVTAEPGGPAAGVNEPMLGPGTS